MSIRLVFLVFGLDSVYYFKKLIFLLTGLLRFNLDFCFNNTKKSGLMIILIEDNLVLLKWYQMWSNQNLKELYDTLHIQKNY